MIGFSFVYGYLTTAMIGALLRPWIGIIAIYGLTTLNIEWNWRWVVDRNSGFQSKVTMCLLAGVVLSAFPGQRFRGLPLLACLSLLGFLGLSYLSATQTIDPEKTQFYMHFIWRIVFIAIVAVRLLDTPQKVNWMLWAIALGLGYNAYGINREYFDIGFCRYVYNSNWAWLGSNQWAMLFVCSASISFSLVFFSKRLWQKALAGILLLLSAHAVMLLESRGSMLGLIGMWLLAVIFMPKNKTTIGMMALALFAVSLLVGPSVVEEFSSIFNKGDDLDSSASSRMDLWRAGWMITMEYPLLGVGPYAGQRLVPMYLPYEIDRTYKGLHNLFFEISTGSGLPAAILFVLFSLLPWLASLLILLRRAQFKKLPTELKAAFFSALIGLFGFWICNMFSSGSLVEGSYVLAVIANSAALIYSREYRNAVIETAPLGSAASSRIPYRNEEYLRRPGARRSESTVLR